MISNEMISNEGKNENTDPADSATVFETRVAVTAKQEDVYRTYLKHQRAGVGRGIVNKVCVDLGVKSASYVSYTLQSLVAKGLLDKLGPGLYRPTRVLSFIGDPRRFPVVRPRNSNLFGRGALTQRSRDLLDTWEKLEKELHRSPTYEEAGRCMGVSRQRIQQLLTPLANQGYLELRVPNSLPPVAHSVMVAINELGEYTSRPLLEDILVGIPATKKQVKTALNALCRKGVLLRLGNRYLKENSC